MRIIIGIILFILAIILIILLSIFNFAHIRTLSYFRDSALSLDKWGNREFRYVLNKYLKVKEGYNFGNINETISAVLGHNIKLNTLTPTGKFLVYILSEKHCIEAIINETTKNT